MATQKRTWTQYPSAYAALAKSIAMADLPAAYGPFEKSAAWDFRTRIYRFRDALRVSVTPSDGTYPVRLYEILSMLSISVTRTVDDPNLYNVVFDLDPVIQQQERIDPASRQIRELAHAAFVAAQQPMKMPTPMSEPIFTDEEFKERHAAILGGDEK